MNGRVGDLPPVEDWPDDVRELLYCMASVVGEEPARMAMTTILDHCAGRQIYIPSFKNSKRREQIIQAIESGLSTNQIAKSFEVDRSTVSRYRKIIS